MSYEELSAKLNLFREENELLKLQLAEAMALQLRMETELTAARDIQIRMVPRVFPAFPDQESIDIYAKLIPAREVGGDFYDYYFLDANRIAIVMGDVSGKGVAAALLMAVCKALLKSASSKFYSCQEIIAHVNEVLAADNHNFMFVTVFMAIIDLENAQLSYTNAGHNPTFIRKKNGSLIRLSDLHGPVLAAMSGLQYGESQVDLEEGDMIFAYTDGVTEAHNPKGELFTDKRLESVLINNKDCTPKQIVEDVFAETLLFERGTEQFDDITALCMEYKGKSNN